MATGITKRHSRTCRSRSDGACNCQPSYEAWIYSKREGKKIRKSFARKSEAKSWRANAKSALAKGGLRAPTPTTLHEAWDAWYAGALADAIRNASGDTYKPSALRGYERRMRLRVLPAIGAMRLSDICRRDVRRSPIGCLPMDSIRPRSVPALCLRGLSFGARWTTK